MIGGDAAPWLPMMTREASKPSITGMFASIRIAAYWRGVSPVPVSREADTRSTASLPFIAVAAS